MPRADRGVAVSGGNIQVVRWVRELEDFDLKQAREAIDELEQRLRTGHPDRFAASARSAGRTS